MIFCDAAFAMFEPVTVTVHLKDVNVVSEAIKHAPVKRSQANTLVH